jgi:hypothetical protein
MQRSRSVSSRVAFVFWPVWFAGEQHGTPAVSAFNTRASMRCGSMRQSAKSFYIVFAIAAARDAELQIYQPAPNLAPQIWYEFEIDVRGHTYTVDLTNLTDGTKTRTSTFVNANGVRGIATANAQPAGYIGLQSDPGAQLAFRVDSD